MTIDDKKEYLRSYQSLAREIEQKQYSLLNLMDSRDSITSILSDMPRGVGNKDKTLIADEIIDLQIDLKEKLKKAMTLRIDIKNKIDEVQEIDERIVLSYKYIDNLRFEDIAERMMFSVRSIFYLHNKGLKNIEI